MLSKYLVFSPQTLPLFWSELHFCVSSSSRSLSDLFQGHLPVSQKPALWKSVPCWRPDSALTLHNQERWPSFPKNNTWCAPNASLQWVVLYGDSLFLGTENNLVSSEGSSESLSEVTPQKPSIRQFVTPLPVSNFSLVSFYWGNYCCFFCFVFQFLLFAFLLFALCPLPSSQINTQRHILSYECLALTWFISIQLSLA